MAQRERRVVDRKASRERRSLQSGRPRDVVGHVHETPRPPTSTAPSRAPSPAAPAWAATAAGRARRAPRAAPPTCSKRGMPALMGLIVREAGKIAARTRSPKCARRSTSCATTRREVGATVRRYRTAARPRRLHQPVEFPAGDLHRPGRRGAGRRQRGARQAGRADAARSPPRRCGCCTKPACRRRRCSCCRARRDRRRRAGRPMRASRRDVHRLDRGRAADPEASSPAG